MQKPFIPENVILYPSIGDVFVDISLEPYFKPLLTFRHQEYLIHLLSTDGLYIESGVKYAESGLWGFQYENGKYRFLGDLSVFGNNNIPEIYHIIKTDFEEKKAYYLSEYISHKTYWEAIEDKLINIADLEDYQDVQDYAESYYSYFLSKYNYEQTQNFCYIMELVANFHHDENDILLDEATKRAILEEYFLNLKDHISYDYGFSPDMVVCATEGFRFTRYGGTSFAFLDQNTDIIYIMEYHT